MTTYWACQTWPLTVHCGWHTPVLEGGDEIAAAGRVDGRGVVGRALLGLGVAVVGGLVVM
jgi:hypothetical protein